MKKPSVQKSLIKLDYEELMHNYRQLERDCDRYVNSMRSEIAGLKKQYEKNIDSLKNSCFSLEKRNSVLENQLSLVNNARIKDQQEVDLFFESVSHLSSNSVSNFKECLELLQSLKTQNVKPNQKMIDNSSSLFIDKPENQTPNNENFGFALDLIDDLYSRSKSIYPKQIKNDSKLEMEELKKENNLLKDKIKSLEEVNESKGDEKASFRIMKKRIDTLKSQYSTQAVENAELKMKVEELKLTLNNKISNVSPNSVIFEPKKETEIVFLEPLAEITKSQNEAISDLITQRNELMKAIIKYESIVNHYEYFCSPQTEPNNIQSQIAENNVYLGQNTAMEDLFNDIQALFGEPYINEGLTISNAILKYLSDISKNYSKKSDYESYDKTLCDNNVQMMKKLLQSVSYVMFRLSKEKELFSNDNVNEIRKVFIQIYSYITTNNISIPKHIHSVMNQIDEIQKLIPSSNDEAILFNAMLETINILFLLLANKDEADQQFKSLSEESTRMKKCIEDQSVIISNTKSILSPYFEDQTLTITEMVEFLVKDFLTIDNMYQQSKSGITQLKGDLEHVQSQAAIFETTERQKLQKKNKKLSKMVKNLQNDLVNQNNENIRIEESFKNHVQQTINIIEKAKQQNEELINSQQKIERMNSIKEANTKLQEENESLKTRLKLIENQNNSLIESCKKSDSIIRDIEKRLKSSLLENRELFDQNNNLTKKTEETEKELNSKLFSLTQRINRVSEEYENQLSKLKEDNDSMKLSVSSVNEEMAQLNCRKTDFMNEISKLRSSELLLKYQLDQLKQAQSQNMKCQETQIYAQLLSEKNNLEVQLRELSDFMVCGCKRIIQLIESAFSITLNGEIDLWNIVNILEEHLGKYISYPDSSSDIANTRDLLDLNSNEKLYPAVESICKELISSLESQKSSIESAIKENEISGYEISNSQKWEEWAMQKAQFISKSTMVQEPMKVIDEFILANLNIENTLNKINLLRDQKKILQKITFDVKPVLSNSKSLREIILSLLFIQRLCKIQ